jgi:hypothetical protein
MREAFSEMPGTFEKRRQERRRIGELALQLRQREPSLTTRAITQRFSVSEHQIRACMREVAQQ